MGPLFTAAMALILVANGRNLWLLSSGAPSRERRRDPFVAGGLLVGGALLVASVAQYALG